MATPANIVFGGVTVVISADLGYVKDGVTIAKSEEIYRPSGIETLLTSPVARRVSEEYTITFTLMEPTLENLKLAWDETAAIVGAAPRTINVGGTGATPTESVLVVTGIEPGGTDIRSITFDKAIAMGPGEHKITQFEEAAFPCTFVTLFKTTATARLFAISDA